MDDLLVIYLPVRWLGTYEPDPQAAIAREREYERCIKRELGINAIVLYTAAEDHPFITQGKAEWDDVTEHPLYDQLNKLGLFDHLNKLGLFDHLNKLGLFDQEA